MSSFTFDRPASLKALRISFLLCVVMVVVVCAIAIVDAYLGTDNRGLNDGSKQQRDGHRRVFGFEGRREN